MNAPALPGALQTETTSGLHYRVLEPRPAAPRALIVLLHGVGGNEMNLATLAAALPGHFLVVLARGPLDFAPGQHGWFCVAFGAQGPQPDLAQAESARTRLRDFVRALQHATGLASSATLVAGFSQGGIMSASLALTEPESQRAFGILSGRILPELEAQLAPRARLGALRAFVSHGEADATLPASWAERAERWLEALGIPTTARRDSGGHQLSTAAITDFVRWAQQTLAEAVQLRLDSAGLSLTNEAGTILLPGADPHALVREVLRHSPPTPLELETAIQRIEDTLQPAAADFRQRNGRLVTRDAWFDEVARFCGGTQNHLTRAAVEAGFSTLAALAEGRPPGQDPLPAEPAFAARLLVLRELMHHLDFDTLDKVGAPA